eukprot:g13194.t1
MVEENLKGSGVLASIDARLEHLLEKLDAIFHEISHPIPRAGGSFTSPALARELHGLRALFRFAPAAPLLRCCSSFADDPLGQV